MEYLFVQYPKCTTCRKAKKFLEENNISFIDRNIVEEKPTEEEIREWLKISGLEIKKFFNTSGVLYKEMNLKDKLKTMTIDEQITLLASDGKLVKRPVLVSKETVLVGFKEEKYKELI